MSRRFLFLSGAAHRALDPNATQASGGAELQVALLSKELVKRGHEVTIAASGDDFPDRVRWDGIQIRSAGNYAEGGIKATLRSIQPVLAILREEKPDYVVVYGWTSWLALLCALKRDRYKVIFVCALDGELDGTFREANPFRGRLFDWGIEKSDFRFGITDTQRQMFLARGLEAEVTRLLLKNPRATKPVAKDIDLLWVARCQPVKQPGMFLDLAKSFPKASCCMICSPQNQALFDGISERAQKISNLNFLSNVPYSEIQSYFDRASVFVNTSSDEGVPNTFLHSGQGAAAIASLTVDPDGLIAKFGAGFCAGGDPDLLEKGISRLLHEPAVKSAASVGSRSFLSAWHNNDENVQAFLRPLT